MSHTSLVSFNSSLISSVTMDQLRVQPSEEAPSHNMPFLKLSISQLALRTLPPSPEDVKSSPHHPRFLLPKFLRKTQPTRLPNFLGKHSSVTHGPPQPTSPTANNAPSCPPGSMFRTAEHTREPFPLILPASPAQSDPSANKRCNTQTLRKAPLSCQNLRAFLPQQDTGKKTSKPVVLLPSPVFSETQIDQASGSYFASLTSNNLISSPDRLDEGSWTYEEHGIVSSYYDNKEAQKCGRNTEDISQGPQIETSSNMKQLCETRRDIGIVCAPSSFPPYQRHPQSGRSRSCSTEADWLAGNMSEKTMLEEWLGDLPPLGTSASAQDEEDGNHDHVVSVKISCPYTSLTLNQMHATRVRCAGKPKVVTIPHSMSLSAASTSTVHDSQSSDRPSTPTRPCQEISVFSPDTPVKYSPRTLNYAATSLQPAALTPHRYHRGNFATPQRSSSAHSQSIRSSLELSPTESQDTFATDFSNCIATSPIATRNPAFSTTSEAAAWSRCKKLEGIIETVSRAMDTFPNDMLRLDSPAVLALRAPNSLDEMLIVALQRVFPQTTSLLLSALAALLIVDSYFSSFGEAYTSLRRLPSHCSKRNYGELAARSNECLLDIPVKARATLGIDLPDLQDHERALRRRADMVAVCVRVHGQRLLQAIYGRFDEVIWRALRVLVETLERNPS